MAERWRREAAAHKHLAPLASLLDPGPESVRGDPIWIGQGCHEGEPPQRELSDWRHAAAVAIWGGLGFGLLALVFYLAQLTVE